MSNGAREPVFGVTIGAMKQLYATGNYDTMYLSGMIAEPKKM